MKKEEMIEQNELAYINYIFKQNIGKRIMLDLEIEENELAYINYYLSIAEYLDGLNILTDLKRKEIKSALKMVITAAKVIVNKVDEILKSDKFNSK